MRVVSCNAPSILKRMGRGVNADCGFLIVRWSYFKFFFLLFPDELRAPFQTEFGHLVELLQRHGEFLAERDRGFRDGMHEDALVLKDILVAGERGFHTCLMKATATTARHTNPTA